MKLTINDLKNGTLVVVEGAPHAVLRVDHLHMGRGGASVQTKMRNLLNGKTFERNYKTADEFESADVEKIKGQFLYESRGVYWFHEMGNPKNRFSFSQEDLGEETTQFLKLNLEVTAIKFGDKFVNIELPIKVDYRVIEAPPSVKGNTAQGGSKVVVIEGGAKISTPLFIETGDVIRVNTQVGEYVERAEKA
ncbi:MAG: elongation factor P [Candidatus Colwellbacteria bacterium]|nr:elongation factor P [Candidatus Colwellbacteria bacterium]